MNPGKHDDAGLLTLFFGIRYGGTGNRSTELPQNAAGEAPGILARWDVTETIFKGSPQGPQIGTVRFVPVPENAGEKLLPSIDLVTDRVSWPSFPKGGINGLY